MAGKYPLLDVFKNTGYKNPYFIRGIRARVSSILELKIYWISAYDNSSLKPKIHIHCYEVTVVKVEIKIFGVTPEIFVSSASHICNAILTVSGRSSDLTVPGMWPLCYAWIGYLQANGSAANPAIY